jgi:murein L,D-transpeptidase YcbB/YkuD
MSTVYRLMLMVVLLSPFPLKAIGDPFILSAIKQNKGSLYYPNEVARFYQQNGDKLAWIAPDTVKTHAWDAMLLLDCIKQYGLNHADYHPKQLLYPELHQLIAQKTPGYETAVYDVLLTDAMIRFMNDLHYGKLNPLYTSKKIDDGVKFKANDELLGALQGNNFLAAIENVQPKSKLYTDMQDHMRLLVGQRSGDCYVIPKGLIRKMAINMERLRWISTTRHQVHLTCIVREGLVIEYKDIYHQDKGLERALYNEGHFLKPKLNIHEITTEKL